MRLDEKKKTQQDRFKDLARKAWHLEQVRLNEALKKVSKSKVDVSKVKLKTPDTSKWAARVAET